MARISALGVYSQNGLSSSPLYTAPCSSSIVASASSCRNRSASGSSAVPLNADRPPLPLPPRPRLTGSGGGGGLNGSGFGAPDSCGAGGIPAGVSSHPIASNNAVVQGKPLALPPPAALPSLCLESLCSRERGTPKAGPTKKNGATETSLPPPPPARELSTASISRLVREQCGGYCVSQEPSVPLADSFRAPHPSLSRPSQ
jgi:hypothetical protein